MPSEAIVRAAGGIVVRAGGSGGWEVIVVHRPVQDDWSLPKGKREAGESDEECAVREVREETGWLCALEREVGRVSYRDSRDRPKIVRYWLMRPVDHADGEPTHEVDQTAWLPIGRAGEVLTYRHDRELVGRVARALLGAAD